MCDGRMDRVVGADSAVPHGMQRLGRMKHFLAIALLALLWFVPVEKASATTFGCTSSADNCDQGQAYAACQTGLAFALTITSGASDWYCAANNSGNPRTYFFAGPPYGSMQFLSGGHQNQFYYPAANLCTTRPVAENWDYNSSAGGDQPKCYNGCKYTGALDSGSPTGASYGATGDVCKVGEFGAPVIDTDGDGTPDADDAFPNDPNETADSDGDGIGDNADFAPEDPTDGKDNPGEEDGDDEGDNIASGGGDCNSPPTCSGDGIQCAQLATQWKIMCKGARVTGTPEVCASSYTCEGDSAQCAEIALLRKDACTDAVVGSDAAQELLEGLQGGPADQNLNPMSVWHAEDDAEADDTGYGLTRTCPPGIAFYGKTISMPCDLGAIIAAIILLAGFVQFGYAFVER